MSREEHVVSSAERTQDKRKQQASEAVAAARGGGGNRMVIAGIAIIVVLVVVVGGAVLLQGHNKKATDLPAAIPPAAAGPQYPVVLQGDAIVTGSLQAPVTIDVYEDFLCPHCGKLEQTLHPRLAQAAADGKIKLVYHPVSILDRRSVPAGYSTLAAGASYCAASAGIFPRFHDSLFAHQPTEGAPAWTVAQLQQLGTALGAGPGFASCVQTGAEQRVTTATNNANKYVSGLRADHEFGTPTVLLNGAVVEDPFDGQWLDKALSGAQR
jgi:protein-disulfide isomerase